MLRKFIQQILVLPFCLYVVSNKSLLSQTKENINESLQEEIEKLTIDYTTIDQLISQNNLELRSLKELLSSATFNLRSKIAKRYPSLDLQATGLPKYVAGKNFNSNSSTTKTSQFSINPSLNLRWDLIDPLRGPEIKIAKSNYEIAKNNYEIKRKDLIQEAKSRFHKLQKSHQEIINKKLSLNLSITSLSDAKSKFDAGIGTRFEVLEAEAQLARDKHSLNETKIKDKINEISLKEILNIERDLKVRQDQKVIGFWNYKLYKNINVGLEKNLSLKNIKLEKSIKQNQANSFLNASRPKIYISNSLSSSFSRGDSLSLEIDPKETGSTYTNTISLNLNWKLFDGGQNKNSYKSKLLEAQSQDYSFENLESVLKTNISKSYLNLKLNQEKILSSIKEISSTKESLRLSRLRYEIGISTLKDVLIRQKELSNANSKNIDAVYNYNLNLDELERLTFLKMSNTCNKGDNSSKKANISICDI